MNKCKFCGKPVEPEIGIPELWRHVSVADYIQCGNVADVEIPGGRR